MPDAAGAAGTANANAPGSPALRHKLKLESPGPGPPGRKPAPIPDLPGLLGFEERPPLTVDPPGIGAVSGFPAQS